jgi:hypothetical protein
VAVSRTSSEACTAVGHCVGKASAEAPLAERRNGTERSLQTTAGPLGKEKTTLDGVSCPSTTSCAAVGNAGKAFAEVYG